MLNVRNLISGFLLGPVFAVWVIYFILYDSWVREAPRTPDPAHGLINYYKASSAVIYVSDFQWVTLNLPFAAIAVAFFAALIGPKKNIETKWFYARWQPHDPSKIGLFATVISFLAALLAARYCGHQLVDQLISMGFHP